MSLNFSPVVLGLLGFLMLTGCGSDSRQTSASDPAAAPIYRERELITQTVAHFKAQFAEPTAFPATRSGEEFRDLTLAFGPTENETCSLSKGTAEHSGPFFSIAFKRKQVGGSNLESSTFEFDYDEARIYQHERRGGALMMVVDSPRSETHFAGPQYFDSWNWGLERSNCYVNYYFINRIITGSFTCPVRSMNGETLEARGDFHCQLGKSISEKKPPGTH